MIKVICTKKFTLKDYDKLTDVNKVEKRQENEFGPNDTFVCDEDMVQYLFNNNVIKLIEVLPEKTKRKSKRVD